MAARKGSITQIILRGAAVSGAGGVAAVGLIFLWRTQLARQLGTEGYGVFALALVGLNVLALLATAGLQTGARRMLAHAEGRGGSNEIPELVATAIAMPLALGGVLGASLYASAGWLAGALDEPALAPALRAMAFAVPTLALLNVLGSVFLGLGRALPKSLYRDVLLNLTFLLLVLLMAYGGLTLSLAYAYVAAVTVGLLGMAVHALYSLRGRWPGTRGIRFGSISVGLLVFSAPLFGIEVLYFVVGWTDTVMLGALAGAAEVGIYNAAMPLAQLISFALAPLGAVYLPAMSRLHAQGKYADVRASYQRFTRWLGLLTLPAAAVMVVYPEATLGILFGADYVAGATALRILAAGFLANNLAGPNAATLVALGHPRAAFAATLIVGLLNVGLNAVLIPRYGIEGAAVASLVALGIANLGRALLVYHWIRVWPLAKGMTRTALAYGLFAAVFGWWVPAEPGTLAALAAVAVGAMVAMAGIALVVGGITPTEVAAIRRRLRLG